MDSVAARTSQLLQQQGVMQGNIENDIKAITRLGSLYRTALGKGQNIEPEMAQYTQILEDFVTQLGAIRNYGELANKPLIEGFFELENVLAKLGVPLDNLREKLIGITDAFVEGFNPRNANKSFLTNADREINKSNLLLEKANKRRKDLITEQKKMEAAALWQGGSISREEVELGFDDRLERIKKYQELLYQEGVTNQEIIETYRKMIDLVRETDKIVPVGKDSAWDKFLQDSFKANTSNVIDKLLQDYRAEIDVFKDSIQTELSDVNLDIRAHEGTLKKFGISNKKKDKSFKSDNLPLIDTDNPIASEVTLRAKIDDEQWLYEVNRVIDEVIQPRFNGDKAKKINVALNIKENDKLISSIAEKLKRIREDALVDAPKDSTDPNAELGDTKDVQNFQKRLDKLTKYITNNKHQLTDLLKEFRKEIDALLKFEVSIDGFLEKDQKSLEKSLSTTVETLNGMLANKPLEFHSNIEKLVEKINEKIKAIDAGDISVGYNLTGGSLPVNGAQSLTLKIANGIKSISDNVDKIAKDAVSDNSDKKQSLSKSDTTPTQEQKKVEQKTGKKSPISILTSWYQELKKGSTIDVLEKNILDLQNNKDLTKEQKA